MKLFNALTFLIKAILSIAGIVFLINRLQDSREDERYQFTIDSALNHEKQKVNNRFSARKRFDFGDLQNAYFRSRDL